MLFRSAISAVLMIVGTVVPLVGLFILMAAAVPISILVVKQNLSMGIMGSVVVMVLIMVIFGPLVAIGYTIQYVSLGLIIGWMLQRRKSAFKVLGAGIIVSILSSFVTMGISMFIMGVPLEQLTNTQGITEQMIEFYRQTGMLDNILAQGTTEAQFRAEIASMASITMKLYPAFMAMVGTMIAFFHYWITIAILKKLKIKVPKMPHFSQWVLPYNAVWGLIVAWVLWLGSDYLQLPWLSIIGQNILVIYAVLLGVFGLAVVFHWINFAKQSTAMKVLFVVMMVFFFSGVAMISLAVGLADLLFDFRKLRKKPVAKSKK